MKGLIAFGLIVACLLFAMSKIAQRICSGGVWVGAIQVHSCEVDRK